jgi:hypothetical protein
MNLFSLSHASPWQLPLMIALFLVFLYLARRPFHQGLRALGRTLSNGLRLSSRSVLRAEREMQKRNHDVLMTEGLLQVERELEREFQRVETIVNRDLQAYPAFHRKLSELLHQVDENYRNSSELPPTPPAWVSTIEAVAKIPDTADGGVAAVLDEIRKTLERHHQTAMEEYRKATAVRHSILKKTQPGWRNLTGTLEKVHHSITGLKERASLIDKCIQQYQEIRSGSDLAEQRLSTSAMTQFAISALVMMIAIGGAVINFNLIALPMSEMVGGGSYIGAYKTSNVAALVIILVEASMGLFLMESLRITRLFPLIGTMEERTRLRMVWISFSILATLAGVESALAFMRDQIAADMEMLRQSLTGMDATVRASRSLIPTVGQMVLGFILPFALTFIAIPLESFIHSSRTVAGRIFAWALRALAFFLRLLASICHHLAQVLITSYDIAIFPLIWVEDKFRRPAKETVVPTDSPKLPKLAAPKKEKS